MGNNVPCCIHEGKRCNMPFCKYTFYFELSERYKREWLEHCKKELENYKKVKGDR